MNDFDYFPNCGVIRFDLEQNGIWCNSLDLFWSCGLKPTRNQHSYPGPMVLYAWSELEK